MGAGLGPRILGTTDVTVSELTIWKSWLWIMMEKNPLLAHHSVHHFKDQNKKKKIFVNCDKILRYFSNTFFSVKNHQFVVKKKYLLEKLVISVVIQSKKVNKQLTRLMTGMC